MPSKPEARGGDAKRRGPAEPPGSVEEALDRARRHGRAAIADALDAIHALLDAAWKVSDFKSILENCNINSFFSLALMMVWRRN